MEAQIHLPTALSEFSHDETISMLRELDTRVPGGSAALNVSWRGFWGRANQLAPGTPGAADPRADWTFWVLLAGRLFGKSRAGAEWVQEKAQSLPGSHGALVAPTSDDARKVMLSSGLEHSEGASGLLAIAQPDFRPIYEPSKRTVTWPNGMP